MGEGVDKNYVFENNYQVIENAVGSCVDQKITKKDHVDQGLVEKDFLTQDRVEQDQAVVKELLVDMVKRVRKAVDRYDGMKEDERAKQLKLKLKNKN